MTVLISCKDDTDDIGPGQANMVLVDKTTGMFYKVDLTDGSLTALDSLVYQGEALKWIRDFVYNPADMKLYISLDGSDEGEGRIFSANPATRTATLINDNQDDGWDAVAEMVISNGKLLGTAYLFTTFSDHGLVTIDFNGVESTKSEFQMNGSSMITNGAMGMVFGSNQNELYIANNDVIMISDLSAAVSREVELTYVGFTGMPDLRLTSLEKDNSGKIYGISQLGHLVKVDMTAETVTFVANLPHDDNRYHGLTNLPDGVL